MTTLPKKFALRASALAVSVLAITACSSITGSNISVGRTGDNPAPSVSQETLTGDDAIGRREHPRIVATYGGVYEDRQAEIMVARIVGRLLAAANQPNVQFQVTILDTSEVNAFALPGGYIYVTRGILALASDTSELAAVLAHEIAHVTLRHARARTDKTRTTQIVDRVVTGIFGGDRSSDAAADRTRQSLAAFSQNQELEADREGIKFAGKAGYDPTAAARFLGVMSRFAAFSAGAAKGDGFLSSHPSTPARVETALSSARLFGAGAVGETDREGYLAAISGMTFGDSPAQGSIVGQRFVNPARKFTFAVPQNYALQNAQSAVVGVAGDGEAVRFDSAQVQGNMELTAYLKSGWIAGLKADTVQALNYNGIEMASGLAQTDQWFFRVAVMRMDGEVYRFIFAAKADSQRFAQGFDTTLQSFRRTTAADLAPIRKTSIRLVTAKAGDTANNLATQMANIPAGRDLFFILNNLYPGDELRAGQRYKIVAVQ
ncbi:M48 family metalloprotease [Devosia sp. MC532]|uniref:M48 family metalloprotease n=1 Tax=Devosia sp. MC532 TaxID=2799788 RepID=UPI0018F4F399|nr:M48 family metalloprotease [Devosia sp. MC532]MBJ7578687.1 M48 family metalloprotease [Devosia sp. MC532]